MFKIVLDVMSNSGVQFFLSYLYCIHAECNTLQCSKLVEHMCSYRYREKFRLNIINCQRLKQYYVVCLQVVIFNVNNFFRCILRILFLICYEGNVTLYLIYF